MDKLSTECLLGLRERIDSILKEREKEEDWNENLPKKEQEKIEFETWKALMKDLQKSLKLYIEAGTRYYNTFRVLPGDIPIYTWDPTPGFDNIDWTKKN